MVATGAPCQARGRRRRTCPRPNTTLDSGVVVIDCDAVGRVPPWSRRGARASLNNSHKAAVVVAKPPPLPQFPTRLPRSGVVARVLPKRRISIVSPPFARRPGRDGMRPSLHAPQVSSSGTATRRPALGLCFAVRPLLAKRSSKQDPEKYVRVLKERLGHLFQAKKQLAKELAS